MSFFEWETNFISIYIYIYTISKLFKFQQFWNVSISFKVLFVTRLRNEISNICDIYLRACGVSSGRTPRSYGTGLAHPSSPGFQSWKTAPTGSFVLFPSRMPVILVLAHRIHVLRGAAVGQEFDGLQPCKAGRAPCYRIPRQMTLPTLPSSWGQSYDADRRAENGTLYRPGTLITRVKLSSMLNFTD